MKNKIILVSCMAATLLVSSLSACDKAEKSDGSKITWWIRNSEPSMIKSYDDIEAFKVVQEKLGIDIEFIHPTPQNETEQFNIMAASGNFKDIISYNWNGYAGGPVKAVQDGAILKLDNYIKTKMPNFSKRMSEDIDVDYLARGYDGSISVIPSFSENIITGACFGPQIRQDWLDKLGLEVPKTIDDWYRVLKAFKTQDPNGNGKADEVPFASSGTATFLRFSRAFDGVTDEFYVDGNGKIKFGFIEPEYREFLEYIRKWYEEGLIEKEYVALDDSMVDTMMISDVSGAFIGYSGSAMGNYLAAGRKSNPNFKLVAAPWPTHNNGGAYSGYPYQREKGTAGLGIAISATNKNIEKSLELLDYLYSEEGSILMNWGILGKSYEKVDGGFKFTDEIINNPSGKSPVEAVTKYALTQYPCAVSRADSFMQLNTVFPEQKAAMELWNTADLTRIMPSLSITPEEQSVVTKVMDDIYTLRFEWINKFITGVEPISKWDDVADKIYSMGIEKAIKAYQDAYDRYLKR